MGHDLDDMNLSLLGGVLVLRDNTWETCALDGMRGDFRRLTAQNPRGFSNICAGRHHVEVMVGEKRIALDVVLYPGETLVRRLSRDDDAFVLDDIDTERRFMDLATGGSAGSMASALIDYARMFVAARKRTPEILPDVVLRHVGGVFLDLAGKVAAGAELPPLTQFAYRAGIELVGHAMLFSQIQRLVGLVSMTASQHAAKGDYPLAAQVAMLGLAVLPGEPWLLDLMANLYSDGGIPEEGLPCSEEALRRAHVFPEKIQQQMFATHEEVSAALAAKAD